MLSKLLPFFLIFLLLPLSQKLFQLLIFQSNGWGLMDRPGGRHIHKGPVATIGGLGIIATWLLGIIVFSLLSGSWAQDHWQSIAVISGCAIAILVLGLIDDHSGVTPRFRLIAELVISGVTVLYEPGVNEFCRALSGTLSWASYPLTWIGLVAVVNAMNLVDGMDGLAGSVFLSIAVAVSFLTGALSGTQSVQAVSAFMLIPGIVVFLRHNWNPANAFMGDHGSLAVGYLLVTSALSIHASGPVHTPMDIAVLALIFSYPVLDMLICMVRRRISAQPMMTGDRGHMHHRMLRLGLPVKQSVTSLALWQFAMISPVFLAPWLPSSTLPLLLIPSVAVAIERLFLLTRLEHARLHNLKANAFSLLPEVMQQRKGEQDSLFAEVIVSLRPLIEAAQFEEKGQFNPAVNTLKYFCERKVKGSGFVRVLPDHIVIGIFKSDGPKQSHEDIREDWVVGLAHFSKMFKLIYSTWSLPVYVRAPEKTENPSEKPLQEVA